MVSYYHNSLSVYPKNHSANLSYPATHSWYPNYPPPHHANPNQYIGSATAGGNGSSLTNATAGIQDNDPSSSAMYYPHHHMFHQSSPDWTGYDSFHLNTPNTSLLQSAMGPSAAALHLNQSLNSGLNNSSSNATDTISNGLPNVPPSPPATVNSGCSEMSSPGIAGAGSGSGGHGTSSPHIGGHGTNGNNSSGGGLARQKSPYDWIKKNSYQSQPTPGKYITFSKLASAQI